MTDVDCFWVDTSRVLNKYLIIILLNYFHRYCGPWFSLPRDCWAGAPQSLETSVAAVEASLWQLRHCKVDAWMSGLFCLWDGSVRVYRVTASQAYVCATVVCATDTNAVEHRLEVIDSRAEGPLAPFSFYFSLEVSSGNSNVCYIHQQNNFLLC